MKVSVIVPVLYEEPQLEATMQSLVALRTAIDLEILLVIDVPDPARETQARTHNDPLAAAFEARATYRVGERGFGSALRSGFAHAAGDVMIPFMGDRSDDPETIPRMVARVEEGWDVVAGSRYVRGGDIVGNTSKQRVSRFYSMVMRWAGGPPIHDVSNAFKAYRRSVVEAVATVADSFDISVELTVKAAQAGFRVGEVPSVWTNRVLGSSNFHAGRELRNYGRWLALALGGRFTSWRRAATVRSAGGDV
jgi:glycosyltransferase involved in cell wall biosynthesis